MNRDELTSKIKLCISKVSDIPPEELNEESNLFDDLSLSSLEIIEILSFIEDEVGVEIPVDETQKMASISDIVDYCEKEI